MRVRQALPAALTHPIDEVRFYAASSIEEEFWAADRIVALRCVNAIATEAALLDKAWEAEDSQHRRDRPQRGNIMAEVTSAVRERFWQHGAIAEDAHVELDTDRNFGANALARILVILGCVPKDPLAIAAFERASNTLVGWWKSGDDQGSGTERNFDTESDVSQLLQKFLLHTTPQAACDTLAPVLSAIDCHSRGLQAIMQGLTVVQDGSSNTPQQYWLLWSLFADAVKRAIWVPHLVGEHPEGSELLSAVFLTAFWKDNVRHWRFLEGYAHLLDALFEALPPTAIVLDDYLRFLYHVGERSLPEAFVRIADAMRRGNAENMVQKTNTVFLLEVLLQRHVYGRPQELKRERGRRQAVLLILDTLVDAGSSAAFRMRDDFVTPAT